MKKEIKAGKGSEDIILKIEVRIFLKKSRILENFLFIFKEKSSLYFL